jgi:predicted Zn-dependent protease
MSSFHQTCWSTTIAGCAVLCLMSAATADEPLAQYFEGLRQRRMFIVAETEAQRRLALEKTTPTQRADLTIELSKTYAAHAMFSTGEQRQELFSQAEQVVGELLTSESSSPFRGLLQVQRAMVPAARGAQLRWQSELFPLDEATRTDAAATLREALDRLQLLPEALRIDLQRAQASRPRDGEQAPQPVPARLQRTQREVEFAIATAQLDLARVLPAGADRVAALFAAGNLLDALTRPARPDDIAWQARVSRLEVLRLRGEFDRLAGQVTSLLKSQPPPAIGNAAVAVLVRRWLDDDRPDEALAVIEDHRAQFGLDSEQLQALLVESLLAARRLSLAEQRDELAGELLEKARAVDERLQGPWKVRTSLLLEQTAQEDRYGPELAESVRQAQWAWQNGDVDGAIAAYTRAAAKAHQQKETQLAVEFGLNIASAQIEAGRYTPAVKSLENLLQAYPDHEKSPQADLLRAYALGRIFEQQPTDEHKSAYREALERHRDRFAGSPTEPEATWMLARLLDYEQDPRGAIDLLRQVPTQSPHYPAVIARLAAIFERMIDSARQQEQPTAALQEEAVTTLAPIVEAFPRAPALLSIEQAQVALRLGRILLRHSPPDFARAEALLRRVMDSAPPSALAGAQPQPAWAPLVASASRLQITALAGQGRLEDARGLLDQLADDQPQRILEILNGLTETAADLTLEHRTGIARMQLELAESLKARQAELSDDQQRLLDMSLAQGHAALGQWQTAARLYEEMLWKQPKDRQIVASLARLYEECGTDSCLQQALKQWQTLESLQRKGSLEWLKTRYRLALCSHRLGDDQTARKLIGVTRVLYPQLGSPSLKARFEALAAELQPGAK